MTLFLSLFLTAFTFGKDLRIATFDSGFGGYFTTKAIEAELPDLGKNYDVSFSLTHYGDTLNAPYGEKTPGKIAELSAAGISRALDDGADMVFIACNTASTQFAAIEKLLAKRSDMASKRVISIVDASVAELKRLIDSELKAKPSVTVALLATPATIRAQTYRKALVSVLGAKVIAEESKRIQKPRWRKEKGATVENVAALVKLELPAGKSVTVIEAGPANWVELIEHGAPGAVKKEIVAGDLRELYGSDRWDIVAEFCTHFPAIDSLIKEEAGKLGLVSPGTKFIQQGPLMARTFREMLQATVPLRKTPVVPVPVRGKIFISGDNLRETAALAREIFPQDPAPEIIRKSFR